MQHYVRDIFLVSWSSVVVSTPPCPPCVSVQEFLISDRMAMIRMSEDVLPQ